MKSFKTFITEKRSHPELNPHLSLMDNLEKYKDDPNMFITYTAHLSSKFAAGEKVGINPKSTFNTPIGVYTYPLKEAWKLYALPERGILKVPYVGTQPYVHLLKRKGKYINDIGVDYTSKDWDRDIKKLRDHFIPKWAKLLKVDSEYDKKHIANIIFNNYIDEVSKNAYHQSIGGRMWNITRLIDNAHNAKFIRDVDIQFIFKSPIDPRIDMYVVKAFRGEILVPEDRLKMKYHSGYLVVEETLKSIHTPYPRDKDSSSWNIVWRMLGYDSIGDRSGNQIIHEAEPTQAVFLSKKGYDVIGAFNNSYRKDFKIHWFEKGISNGSIEVSLAKYNVHSKDFEWSSGLWHKGVWKDGTWERGQWETGTWVKGLWKFGSWFGGTWEGGTWEDGEWHKGTWMWGTWKEGVWFKGTWQSGSWEGGEWHDGTWENGTWWGGRWISGTWDGGMWMKGQWDDGTWKRGSWYGGEWWGGTWEDGRWEGGTWYGGIWKRGIWDGGTWKGGYDKNGNYHKAGDSPDKWQKS